MSRLFLAIPLLLCSVPLAAHDYWFVPSGDDYRLHRGHRHSAHAGAEEVPFDPADVSAARCLGPTAARPDPAPVSGTYPPRIAGPCLAIVAEVDSGYWSQTITGTKNQPKTEVFGVLRSWQALETVKRVEAWSEQLREPLSTGLELVFRENPFAAGVGGKLRLTALRDGQPLGGVTVAYDGEPRGVTDASGHINLRVRHAGTQVITASLEEPLDGRLADRRVSSTILLFELN